MDTPSPDRRSLGLLAFAGLCSALLMLGAERLLKNVASGPMATTVGADFHVGLIFGVSLAIYFALVEGVRAPVRVLAFITACVVAYPAALSAVVGVLYILPPGPPVTQGTIKVPLTPLFAAGVVGALLVHAAALLFLGSGRAGWGSIRRLLAWASGGGVLAVAGFSAGPLLGRALLVAFEVPGLRPSGETFDLAVRQQIPEYLSLYVVWQTGVAATIGLMLSREFPVATLPPVQAPAARRKLSPVALIFMLGVFAYLAFNVFQSVRAGRLMERGGEALQQSLAEAPSLQNLPALTQMPPEDAFVAEEISGLLFEPPRARMFSAYEGRPAWVSYSARYLSQRDADPAIFQRAVRVDIAQYPNIEWAGYRAKYPDSVNVALDDPKSLTTVTKFGSRIVMNSVHRRPDGTGELIFLWPSGTFVITIRFDGRYEDDEFIRRYLEKYPAYNFRMWVSAILAAGGRGTRMGAPVPKQMLTIGSRTILQRSFDTIEAHDQIAEIIVALPSELVASPPPYLTSSKKQVVIVDGGERRQDSVANAFARVSPRAEVVVIHDAARPFATHQLFSRVIDAAVRDGAAIAAMQASDTVKESTGLAGARTVARTMARESIYLAQTPQAFSRAVLADAIAQGSRTVAATDEASLAEQAGHAVRLIDGDADNVKITTQNDVQLAQMRAGARGMTMRIGTGYDLHRLEPGRPLIIGGVEIPHGMGLIGHSDADVLCHAITDAILGAAAQGDIGRHFPDTDPKWKGADSIALLRSAAAIVRAAGFTISNIDAVVIAEAPKLLPHVDAMRAKLAAAMGIDVGAISVKGKTNEKVGALGRNEAIAVHAVALLAAADQ